MPEQFENPEVVELEDETVSDASAQKRIERVADKAAGKASHTEQAYEKDEKVISI
jgi:hypothetical protein